ncbi:salicylic acid-binding protein 2 [Quercus suber]|uniref:Salicylic acid-binding protein 2 n=1 Tax=Quercus suber TaxID=58331 RepID=A0AAW0LCI7_QUESU
MSKVTYNWQHKVEEMEKKERHFVLVHGACHGAWSWYKVATLLKSAGHKVTALDLAASGIHPKQARELRSLSDYLEPLMEFMASLPADERVILVGHSFGGACISVAMEKFPEKVSVEKRQGRVLSRRSSDRHNLDLLPRHRIVALARLNRFRNQGRREAGFSMSHTTDNTRWRRWRRRRGILCWFMEPVMEHGIFRKLDFPMDSQFTFDQGPNNPPTTMLFGSNLMASKLYQLSPPEDLALAVSLVRPCRLYGHGALLLKEPELTKEKYGSVRRVYIVCDQDSAINEDLQRWMIEKNPTDEVKVITGSDHMVMFSKPKELCSCLEEIVEKYS